VSDRPSSYLLPRRNQVRPIRSILGHSFPTSDARVSYRANILLVDLGGIEPPSETPFSQLQTIILLFIKRNVDNYERTSKNLHPGISLHMDKANVGEKQE
jgi:hypothetical protein